MTEPAGEIDSLLPFLGGPGLADGKLLTVWQADQRRWGRIRNLTRVIGRSRPTWQAVVRSEQMFATMTLLDPPMRALLCLYTSLLNGCAYCIDDAAGAAIGEGLAAEQLLAVAEPATELLGERTLASLRYAYWVTMWPTEVPSNVSDDLRRHVDDEELLEITAVVAMKCFWNRFVSALRIPPEGRCTDTELFNALMEVSAGLRRGHRG